MQQTFDLLNPKFDFLSPVHSPITSRDALVEHIDHAIIALDGRAPLAGDCQVELIHSVDQGQTMKVELWVTDLDEVTCTYGFLATSPDGRTPFARGERSVVNVDPATRRPEKWSREFRASHEALLKDLPAYA